MRFALLSLFLVVGTGCSGSKCPPDGCEAPGPDPGDGGDEDGGTDGGNRQADTDGGGGLDLVGVADESAYALAWTTPLEATVFRWEINSEDSAGTRLPLQYVADGARMFGTETGATTGLQKSFFVAGIDVAEQVVVGKPPAGIDGGAASCSGPADCPATQVCSLGQCKELKCATQDGCPLGYACASGSCFRSFVPDAGNLGTGDPDGGMANIEAPLVSEKIVLQTAQASFSPEVPLTQYAAQNPSLVAADTARQFVAVEQEGQLYGYRTENRGKTFSIIRIDNLGTHPKLAYNAGARVLYACYKAGNGIRVRRSRDFGRTWGGDALDLFPAPVDGGLPAVISECAVAPWRDDAIVVATVELGTIHVRIVNANLAPPLVPDVAFVATPQIANPVHIAVATLPADFVIHIAFTGTRPSGGVTDKDIYSVYRDPQTNGTFTTPEFVCSSTGAGAGYPQDHASLVIDPASKKAIAAYTSFEPAPGLPTDVIYVSIWNPATHKWGVGPDMSIFFKNAAQTGYVVLPERDPMDPWDTFAPSLAITGKGKIFLGFAAGRTNSGGVSSDYHPYAVEFDLNLQSPGAAAGVLGWYVAPAKKLSTTRVGRSTASGAFAGPVLATDPQLSAYLLFIEGVGPAGDLLNRPLLLTRP